VLNEDLDDLFRRWSEIQAATTNAGARTQGGLTPDFLALSSATRHRPIYRQSAILEREETGIELSRATGRWV